jgi:hypothetical protein
MTKPAEIPDPARVRAAEATGSLGESIGSVLAELVGEPLSSFGRAVVATPPSARRARQHRRRLSLDPPSGDGWVPVRG